MIRVYGLREKLDPLKGRLSDLINNCMVEALKFPPNKKVHRFFPLEREDFYYPEGRSDAYTIIEIEMMEGRSVEAKKQLIHLLFEHLESQLGIAPIDAEISLREIPPHNWGFRGQTGDEAKLDYKLNV